MSPKKQTSTKNALQQVIGMNMKGRPSADEHVLLSNNPFTSAAVREMTADSTALSPTS